MQRVSFGHKARVQTAFGRVGTCHSSKPSARKIGVTSVIVISLLQFGQISIVGTTEHARMVLHSQVSSHFAHEAKKKKTATEATGPHPVERVPEDRE
jgi:hypothetical protein